MTESQKTQKPDRIYFRRGGKTGYTALPLRHYSLIDSFGKPDVICVFSDGLRFLDVKYSDITEKSRLAWPLPAHVQEILDERIAIDLARAAKAEPGDGAVQSSS